MLSNMLSHTSSPWQKPPSSQGQTVRLYGLQERKGPYRQRQQGGIPGEGVNRGLQLNLEGYTDTFFKLLL